MFISPSFALSCGFPRVHQRNIYLRYSSRGSQIIVVPVPEDESPVSDHQVEDYYTYIYFFEFTAERVKNNENLTVGVPVKVSFFVT